MDTTSGQCQGNFTYIPVTFMGFVDLIVIAVTSHQVVESVRVFQVYILEQNRFNKSFLKVKHFIFFIQVS